MLLLADHLFEIDHSCTSFGESGHAAGLLGEQPDDRHLAEAGAEHPVKLGRASSPLDMSEHGFTDFLIELHAAVGLLHAGDEGRGIADPFGKDDDGIVPGFLKTLMEQSDDPVHVVEIFRNNGHLGAATNGGGERQITGISSHHLDQKAAAVRPGCVPDPVDQFHDGVGGGIDADGHFSSRHIIVNAGGDADHGQTTTG